MLDVLCVIDTRFTGGTPAAMGSDIAVFLEAGLQVGVAGVRSAYLSDMPDGWSSKVSEVMADRRLQWVASKEGAPIAAQTVFLHHPMTFFYGLEKPLRLQADRVCLVAHHLPFRADGSMQYDPIATSQRIYRKTGARPEWLPVSGVCREQLDAFRPFIRLSALDWPNVFDVDAWKPRRDPFSDGSLVIGRHSRPDPLKWPDRAADVRGSLPNLPGGEIRVMGCPRAEMTKLNVDMTGWKVLEFDEEPVAGFLDGLDVFAYHYHRAYSECFGRTVAEAMLMKAVCVLDPRLEPTFGNLAVYCPPEDTAQVITRLQGDPVAARALASRARTEIVRRHGTSSVMPRLEVLRGKTPQPAAVRPTAERKIPRHVIAKKLVGMVRRREYFEWQIAARAHHGE
ncbi:glycosyltransferase family 4 protein [Salipiger sp. PrR002]|uniref:glycosyltransferase family 4 protein n=1 Tax=Salipiger sp. PrR002 TaxID=2706489 RepID=UPI0013B5D29D|nr:glycosyltransferase family 4 protein [Salipiger sp. PrR002]NDW01741.1 glycosyltransferase family 4 protein [Salipiger sp. PrR002]NDW57822.1 glycosyltransferase family 4 protein [Salipiger sp. PrR004]